MTADRECLGAIAATVSSWNRRLRRRYRSVQSSSASRQLVNFKQTYPRSETDARKNSGVISGRDRYDDGRFQVVRRGLASRLNGRLLGVFPIIVRIDDIAVAIVQAKVWVCQHSGEIEWRLGKGGSEPTEHD